MIGGWPAVSDGTDFGFNKTVSRDISLAAKTKHMETGLHKGMLANEHIIIDSTYYEKVKSFKYLGS